MANYVFLDRENEGMGFALDVDTGQIVLFSADGETIVFSASDSAVTIPLDLNISGDLNITGSFVASSLAIDGELTAGTFGTSKEDLTLGVAADTFAVVSNVMGITGDGGGNTIATIAGGVDGQILTLLFVDANVMITDDATSDPDTVNLDSAFVSSADRLLSLVYDGNKWFEVCRNTSPGFDGDLSGAELRDSVTGSVVFSDNLIAKTTSGGFVLNEVASNTNPTIGPSRNRLNSGYGWDSLNSGIAVVVNGGHKMTMTTTGLISAGVESFGLSVGSATLTATTVRPRRGDPSTGLGADPVIAGVLALIAGNKPGLLIRDQNHSNGETLALKSKTAVISGLSGGARATAADFIPAGSVVLGLTARVTTSITGAIDWDMGDGSDVDAFGAALALASSTTADLSDWTVSNAPVYVSDTAVVLTANGGLFSAGAVRVTVHYLQASAPVS